MLILNHGTNAFTFVATWPDGSTQSVTLLPAQGIEAYAYYDGVVGVTDSWSGVYTVIADNTGVGFHRGFDLAQTFLSGLSWTAFIFLPLVAVWLIVRSIRPSTRITAD